MPAFGNYLLPSFLVSTQGTNGAANVAATSSISNAAAKSTSPHNRRPGDGFNLSIGAVTLVRHSPSPTRAPRQRSAAVTPEPSQLMTSFPSVQAGAERAGTAASVPGPGIQQQQMRLPPGKAPGFRPPKLHMPLPASAPPIGSSAVGGSLAATTHAASAMGARDPGWCLNRASLDVTAMACRAGGGHQLQQAAAAAMSALTARSDSDLVTDNSAAAAYQHLHHYHSGAHRSGVQAMPNATLGREQLMQSLRQDADSAFGSAPAQAGDSSSGSGPRLARYDPHHQPHQSYQHQHRGVQLGDPHGGIQLVLPSGHENGSPHPAASPSQQWQLPSPPGSPPLLQAHHARHHSQIQLPSASFLAGGSGGVQGALPVTPGGRGSPSSMPLPLPLPCVHQLGRSAAALRRTSDTGPYPAGMFQSQPHAYVTVKVGQQQNHQQQQRGPSCSSPTLILPEAGSGSGAASSPRVAWGRNTPLPGMEMYPASPQSPSNGGGSGTPSRRGSRSALLEAGAVPLPALQPPSTSLARSGSCSAAEAHAASPALVHRQESLEWIAANHAAAEAAAASGAGLPGGSSTGPSRHSSRHNSRHGSPSPAIHAAGMHAATSSVAHKQSASSPPRSGPSATALPVLAMPPRTRLRRASLVTASADDAVELLRQQQLLLQQPLTQLTQPPPSLLQRQQQQQQPPGPGDEGSSGAEAVADAEQGPLPQDLEQQQQQQQQQQHKAAKKKTVGLRASAMAPAAPATRLRAQSKRPTDDDGMAGSGDGADGGCGEAADGANEGAAGPRLVTLHADGRRRNGVVAAACAAAPPGRRAGRVSIAEAVHVCGSSGGGSGAGSAAAGGGAPGPAHRYQGTAAAPAAPAAAAAVPPAASTGADANAPWLEDVEGAGDGDAGTLEAERSVGNLHSEASLLLLQEHKQEMTKLRSRSKMMWKGVAPRQGVAVMHQQSRHFSTISNASALSAAAAGQGGAEEDGGCLKQILGQELFQELVDNLGAADNDAERPGLLQLTAKDRHNPASRAATQLCAAQDEVAYLMDPNWRGNSIYKSYMKRPTPMSDNWKR